MERKINGGSAGFYKYAVPLMMFVSTAAAVFLWSYSSSLFGDSFRGYAGAGRMREVLGAFFGEATILFTVLGVLFLDLAAFAFVWRAMKDKKRGALFLMILHILSLVAFAAIIVTAVSTLAA